MYVLSEDIPAILVMYLPDEQSPAPVTISNRLLMEVPWRNEYGTFTVRIYGLFLSPECSEIMYRTFCETATVVYGHVLESGMCNVPYFVSVKIDKVEGSVVVHSGSYFPIVLIGDLLIWP